jgi:hypothetical protein
MSEERLIRIESRLVQIMLHLGMNPYQKAYEATNKHPTSPSLNSCCGEETKGKPAK